MSRDAKMHLVDTGRLLDFDGELVARMLISSDEACEVLFIENIEAASGGVADWRDQGGEVINIVCPLLNASEQVLLSELRLNEACRPQEVVRQVDVSLREGARSIRALDSFGDFVIFMWSTRNLSNDLIK